SRRGISRLANLRLGEGELSDNRATIRRLYEGFSKEDSIGWIGAAKALHILLPQLFVAWDTAIATSYHRIHEDYRKRSNEKERCIGCYLRFLENCESIAAQLRRNGVSILMNNHPARKHGIRRTLAKMIDECNWIRFTDEQNWTT